MSPGDTYKVVFTPNYDQEGRGMKGIQTVTGRVIGIMGNEFQIEGPSGYSLDVGFEQIIDLNKQ